MKKEILIGTIFALFIFNVPGCYLYPVEQQEGNMTKDVVVVKEFGGFWFVHMDFNGPYKLIKEKSIIFKEEFKKQGLTANGSFFLTFYNPPSIYKGEELRWAPSYSVDENTEVTPPLKKTKSQRVLAVTFLHTGPRQTIRQSFDKVQNYIKENNYEKLWPAYEIYHENPREIEVIHPVRKKE